MTTETNTAATGIGDAVSGSMESHEAAKTYIRDWCPDHVKDYITSLEAQPAPVVGGLQEVIDGLRKDANDRFSMPTGGCYNAMHKWADHLAALTTRPAESVAQGGEWDDQAYASMADELEAWKQRALAAEADVTRMCAEFNAENGPTHMGEPVLPTPATGSGGDAVAWVVFDSKQDRYVIFNPELADAIAERGLLTLPVFGHYEWLDAKAETWKPINRLPYTWERELGIHWRAHPAPAGGEAGDSERLDYIERTFSGMTNRERYLPVQMIWGKGAMGRTLREACDKYMARDRDLTAKPGAEGVK